MPTATAEARWSELHRRTMHEVAGCEPIYRPTTFWSSGVQALADDMERLGLERFKSWPSAGWWFYPRYGNGLSKPALDAALAAVERVQPGLSASSLRTALTGTHQARRDFDAVRLTWDHSRWPFDLEGLGESLAGSPPEAIRFEKSSTVSLTRPYLNYLLILAGLSRHVEAPPRRFLELGGGFGVLGEIVLSRDPDAVYVDLDIPPLLTVASFYLDTLFGDRVTTYEELGASGGLDVAGSACLPSWRVRDVAGPFDVFVNSFSFQEMEPEVLERYVEDIAALGVEWIVSLNSRAGKPRKDGEHAVGVLEPVTSAAIVRTFESRGYRLVAAYGEPLLQSRGELAILRRATAGRAPYAPAARSTIEASGLAGTTRPTIDLRRPLTPVPARPTKAPPRKSFVRRVARRLVPQRLRPPLRRLLRRGR
jgi:putative sugar O-methyltransferase